MVRYYKMSLLSTFKYIFNHHPNYYMYLPNPSNQPFYPSSAHHITIEQSTIVLTIAVKTAMIVTNMTTTVIIAGIIVIGIIATMNVLYNFRFSNYFSCFQYY